MCAKVAATENNSGDLAHSMVKMTNKAVFDLQRLAAVCWEQNLNAHDKENGN